MNLLRPIVLCKSPPWNTHCKDQLWAHWQEFSILPQIVFVTLELAHQIKHCHVSSFRNSGLRKSPLVVRFATVKIGWVQIFETVGEAFLGFGDSAWPPRTKHNYSRRLLWTWFPCFFTWWRTILRWWTAKFITLVTTKDQCSSRDLKSWVLSLNMLKKMKKWPRKFYQSCQDISKLKFVNISFDLSSRSSKSIIVILNLSTSSQFHNFSSNLTDLW